MTFNDGWSPELEEQLAPGGLDTLPQGMEFGPGDYEPMPRGYVDPRKWLNINLQRYNDCRGNSLSTGIEVCHYYETGEEIQLSTWFAYTATRLKYDRSGCRDQGATIMGGIQLATEFGLPPEDVMPYPNRHHCDIPDAAWEAAKPFRIGETRRLQNSDQLQAWLESGQGPADAGVPWGSGWHAILFHTYDPTNDTFIFANSHGTRYGEGGHGRYTKREMDRIFNTRGTVVVGITGQPHHAPRDWSALLAEWVKRMRCQ